MQARNGREPERCHGHPRTLLGRDRPRPSPGRGLSQTELGRLVELHYNPIGRYERGESSPSGDVLKRLADALGVTTDFLVQGAEDQAAKARFADRELLRGGAERDVTLFLSVWGAAARRETLESVRGEWTDALVRAFPEGRTP